VHILADFVASAQAELYCARFDEEPKVAKGVFKQRPFREWGHTGTGGGRGYCWIGGSSSDLVVAKTTQAYSTQVHALRNFLVKNCAFVTALALARAQSLPCAPHSHAPKVKRFRLAAKALFQNSFFYGPAESHDREKARAVGRQPRRMFLVGLTGPEAGELNSQSWLKRQVIFIFCFFFFILSFCLSLLLFPKSTCCFQFVVVVTGGFFQDGLVGRCFVCCR
jgi:hypothetical protein